MPPTLANVYTRVAGHDRQAAAGAARRRWGRSTKRWPTCAPIAIGRSNYLKEFAKSDNDKLNEALYNHVIKELSPDGHIEKAWIENGLSIAARAWNMPELAKTDAVGAFHQ